MKKVLVLICIGCWQFATAQQTIRTMFYNLYRFPDRPPAQRELILKDILSEYHPDLFMTCELVREEGADRILNTSLQTPYFNFARAAFTPTADSGDPLQQMVFYNRDKLILTRQQTYPTEVREINHYTFVLNTPNLNTDSVFLDVFVTHLKAGDGTENQLARLAMIDTFVRVQAGVPADHHVLLAGDFNFYSAYDEPAYQKILDPLNPFVMEDPINKPGNWSDNDTFRAIHTQATRTSATGFGVGGATGGLDDRFDFIMISQNLRSGTDLSYAEGSYLAFGNNGNCFNQRVDNYDCEGTYSLELRQKLHNMSDHLPVVMQLQTSRHFLAIQDPDDPDLILFPHGNIATSFLQVKTEQLLPGGNITLSLWNNLGQLIRPVYPASHGNSKEINIYTGDLAAGMYYLRVTGRGTATYKFLKQ